MENMNADKISQSIRACRKRQGLSQDELANRLHVTRQAVSKWERDGGYPEVEKLLVLAAKLDISLDALFEDELNYLKKKQPDDFLKKYPGLLAGLQVFIDNLEKI